MSTEDEVLADDTTPVDPTKPLRPEVEAVATPLEGTKLTMPPGPIPPGFMSKPAPPGKPQVDKYFGTKLPPVCRQLGCYVTDDGKFFYCINPNCHKDRKRETKYNRRRKSVVYFFCPKCKSREIQLHLRANNYECLDCAYVWRK